MDNSILDRVAQRDIGIVIGADRIVRIIVDGQCAVRVLLYGDCRLELRNEIAEFVSPLRDGARWVDE